MHISTKLISLGEDGVSENTAHILIYDDNSQLEAFCRQLGIDSDKSSFRYMVVDKHSIAYIFRTNPSVTKENLNPTVVLDTVRNAVNSYGRERLLGERAWSTPYIAKQIGIEISWKNKQ